MGRGAELFVWIFVRFSLLHTTYSSICPRVNTSKWVEYDNECQRQQSGRRFHCQNDFNTRINTNACAPAITCEAGTRAKIDSLTGTVECVECSSEMYQPIQKVSYEFTQPNCDRRRTKCNKDEIECAPASVTQDIMCSCDHRQMMRPNNIQECQCFVRVTTSCICLQANCAEGEVLTRDFKCILNQSWPVTTKSSESDRNLSTWEIAVIGIGVVVFVVGMAIVIFCYLRSRTKSNGRPMKNEGKTTGEESTPMVQSCGETTGRDSVNTRRDNDLYIQVKALVVRHINPNSLLIYLPLGPADDERESEHISRVGREDGALHLLQTLKRVRPDDWDDCLVTALRHEDLGLSDIADQIDTIRKNNKSRGDNPQGDTVSGGGCSRDLVEETCSSFDDHNEVDGCDGATDRTKFPVQVTDDGSETFVKTVG